LLYANHIQFFVENKGFYFCDKCIYKMMLLDTNALNFLLRIITINVQQKNKKIMAKKNSILGKNDHTGFMASERSNALLSSASVVSKTKDKSKKKKKKKNRKERKNSMDFVPTCSYWF